MGPVDHDVAIGTHAVPCRRNRGHVVLLTASESHLHPPEAALPVLGRLPLEPGHVVEIAIEGIVTSLRGQVADLSDVWLLYTSDAADD